MSVIHELRLAVRAAHDALAEGDVAAATARLAAQLDPAQRHTPTPDLSDRSYGERVEALAAILRDEARRKAVRCGFAVLLPPRLLHGEPQLALDGDPQVVAMLRDLLARGPKPAAPTLEEGT